MFSTVQLQIAVSYSLMLVLSGGLIVYLRLKRRGAYSGDLHASRHVILPSYEPLLWTFCTATGLYAGCLWSAVAVGYVDWLFDTVDSAVMYAGRQFIFLLLLVYFNQSSLSRQALVRSIGIALIISILPIGFALVADLVDANDDIVYVLQMILRAAITAFYVYVLVFPRSRASVATQRTFCIYVLVAQAIEYAYHILFYSDSADVALDKPATTLVM
ncbi:protein kinase, partial [Achlya hypogyna]